MRRMKLILAAAALAFCAAPSLAKAPASWDGLVNVKAKRLALAYLLPHADFRAYTKVMLDPAEVAFAKNWQRDYNMSSASLGGRITDKDMRDAIVEAQASLDKIFAERFAEEGYQVVTEPGPDVLRLSLGIADLTVNAPDKLVAGRSTTYSVEAGEATFVIEARDSLTNQLLGRGIDRREAGEGPSYRRTYSSNKADFEALFDTWARNSARGLTELKSASPVDTDGIKKN